jgi:hypothetical protein
MGRGRDAVVKIKYTKGYKYQLYADMMVKISVIPPGLPIYTKFIDLTEKGLLIIRAGYAWDGASGPTFDTSNSMRASLVHDALCQLCRLRLLPMSLSKKIDREFRRLCIEDGMFRWRAELWYRAVRRFGGFAIEPKNRKRVYVAP